MKRLNKNLIILTTLILIGCFTITVQAAFNEQINFQGKLTGSNNVAVEDDNYNFKFELYATDTEGVALWTELCTTTEQIAITDGLFSHLLGSVTALDDNIFNQTLWLQVSVGGTSTVPSWEILSPRKKLGAVPAAFEAKRLGGYGTSSFAILNLPATITGLWDFNNILSASSSSASTMLTITQNGAGNIVDFKNATGSVFTINNAGDITTGTWRATPIGAAYGGTGTTTASWTGVPYITAGVWGTTTAATANNYGPTVIVAASNSTTTSRAHYTCDGTNDEVEINQAIQAIYSTGGTVQLLEGVYNIATSTGNLYGIQIATSDIALVGSGKGTVLKRSANETNVGYSGVITVGDGTNAYEGIFISNLQIDGDKTSQTSDDNHGILFKQKITRSQIKSTWIYNSAGYGIYLYATSAANGNGFNLIEGNDIMSVNNGIYLYYSTTTAITGNTIRANTSKGIYLYSASDNSVTNNIVRDNTSDGIYLNSANANTITGNITGKNTSNGIWIYSSYNNSITGNTSMENSLGILLSGGASYNAVVGNTVYENGDSGIDLNSASRNTVTGNILNDNTGSGISLTSSDNNSVTGNTAYINSLRGVYLSGSSNNTVSGNKIHYNSSDGIGISNSDANLISSNDITDTSGSSYAINIDSTCDNNYLVGNRYSGTGASSINDSGSDTVYGSQSFGDSSIASLILKPLGNIGIGTTSTIEKLTVAGNLRFGQAPTTFTTTSEAIGSTSTTIPVISTNGYASSGTILIDSEVITYATTTGTAFGGCTRAALGTASTTHAINTTVKNYIFTALANATTPRMVIMGDGNVGIGTTTPATTLQVYGTSAFMSGNVGIGTTSPAAILDIYASSTVSVLTVAQNGTGTIADLKYGATSVFTLASVDKLKLRDGLGVTFGEFNDVILDDFEDNDVTNWTTSDTTNTKVSATTTQIKVNDFAMVITTVVDSSNNDSVTSTPSTADWSGYERLSFWVRADYTSTSTSATATSQIIAFRFYDSTGTTTNSSTTIKEFGEWQYEEIDLSSVASADKDNVTWFGFRANDDYGSPRFYIDQIRLYDSGERTSEIFVDSSGNLNFVSPSKIELTRTAPGQGSLPSVSVGSAVVEFNQPLSVNVGGDVGFDYDIHLANTGLSSITSEGPLRIAAGDPNHFENLTLTTQGTGDVVTELTASSSSFMVTAASNTEEVFIINSEASTTDKNLLQVISDYNADESVKFIIKSDGKIGIGTTTPGYLLTIDALATATVALGVHGSANFTGVVTQNTSLDVAERYLIDSRCQENDNCPETGDLVSITEGQIIQKTRVSYDAKLIGIVSGNAGFVLEGGLEASSSRLVALVGRVPVKVSLENGPIEIGDALTSASSNPGVAMKATGAGRVIGIALKAFATSGEATSSQIMVFVNPHWQGNDLSIAQNGEGQLINTELRQGLAEIGLIVNEYGVLEVEKVKTQELCVGSVCVTETDFIRVFGENIQIPNSNDQGGGGQPPAGMLPVNPISTEATSTEETATGTEPIAEIPSVEASSTEATPTEEQPPTEDLSPEEPVVVGVNSVAEGSTGTEPVTEPILEPQN